MKYAAELKLEIAYANTKRLPLHITVGVPRRHLKSDWYCLVRLGSDRKAFRIFGVDSWQALTLALKYVEINLHYEVRRGAKLYRLGHRVSLRRLFAREIRP